MLLSDSRFLLYRLLRFNFLPECIIEIIRLGSKITVNLRILQLICIREYRFIFLIFRIQDLERCLVRGCVGDVLEVLHRDIRAAEEDDPLLRVLLILRVVRDDPGIDPQVCSLFRKNVLKIIIEIQCLRLFLEV